MFIQVVICYYRPFCSRAANAVTLSRLLAQAVQSGDRTLLEEPLRVRKDVIIRQTIRRLPVTLVVPLLKQVTAAAARLNPLSLFFCVYSLSNC